jgi:hypothetical protein
MAEQQATEVGSRRNSSGSKLRDKMGGERGKRREETGGDGPAAQGGEQGWEGEMRSRAAGERNGTKSVCCVQANRGRLSVVVKGPAEEGMELQESKRRQRRATPAETLLLYCR